MATHDGPTYEVTLLFPGSDHLEEEEVLGYRMIARDFRGEGTPNEQMARYMEGHPGLLYAMRILDEDELAAVEASPWLTKAASGNATFDIQVLNFPEFPREETSAATLGDRLAQSPLLPSRVVGAAALVAQAYASVPADAVRNILKR